MITIGNTVISDIKEIAAKFKLTPTTIRRYIKEGRLSGQKVGTRWFVSDQAIANFFMQPCHKAKRTKDIKINLN